VHHQAFEYWLFWIVGNFDLGVSDVDSTPKDPEEEGDEDTAVRPVEIVPQGLLVILP